MIRKDDSGNSLSESEAGSPDAIFQEQTSSLVLLLVPGVFTLGGGPHQRTERSQWLRSRPQTGPRPPTPTDGLEQGHGLAEKHSPSLRHSANSLPAPWGPASGSTALMFISTADYLLVMVTHSQTYDPSHTSATI